MANETLAQALEREHREIDAGLAVLQGGGAAFETVSAAIAALRRHIYLEEEMLFPALRGAGLVAPVFVMIREHGELWGMLDELEGLLAASAGDDSLREVTARLEPLLEAHNMKEESILYPRADHVMNGPASAELSAFMASGEMPAGWVCQGAR